MEKYGVAHSIAVRFGPGEASSEELGAAMNQYRNLFDHLLQLPKGHEAPQQSSRLGSRLSSTSAPAM